MSQFHHFHSKKTGKWNTTIATLCKTLLCVAYRNTILASILNAQRPENRNRVGANKVFLSLVGFNRTDQIPLEWILEQLLETVPYALEHGLEVYLVIYDGFAFFDEVSKSSTVENQWRQLEYMVRQSDGIYQNYYMSKDEYNDDNNGDSDSDEGEDDSVEEEGDEEQDNSDEEKEQNEEEDDDDDDDEDDDEDDEDEDEDDEDEDEDDEKKEEEEEEDSDERIERQWRQLIEEGGLGPFSFKNLNF
jgi:hypothetical protein